MGAIRKTRTDLIETDVDDETIIVQLDNGQLYSVEGSARAIWRKLDKEPSRNELIAAIATDFDVAPQVIAADVDAFLAEAKKAGIVTF